MPKLGMEPIRRAALVEAAVCEIGQAGSLDVTVSQIAKRAGMSSALAHHYFGGKDQIFLAALRHILRGYGQEVRQALHAASDPKDRLGCLIAANFSDSCFEPDTVAAWLQFYVHAQCDPAAARLLRVYHRRLHSNLSHALRAHPGVRPGAATLLGAVIDGAYLRVSLGDLSLAEGAAVVRAAAQHMGATL